MALSLFEPGMALSWHFYNVLHELRKRDPVMALQQFTAVLR